MKKAEASITIFILQIEELEAQTNCHLARPMKLAKRCKTYKT